MDRRTATLSDFKITQLRHFVWVAELKGFRAAAEKAYRTQPAISLSISSLEEKLGNALFEKTPTRMSKAELTAFGQYFLPKAKELLAYHDRVSEDVMLLSTYQAGHLRLASVPSIASRVLPGLLQEFIQTAPNLHISFFDDNSVAVLNMVAEQKVDFGIAHYLGEDENPDIDFTPIWEDQIGVVCPQGHPLAQQSSLHWQDLQGYPMISNGTSRLLENSEAKSLLNQSQLYVSNMISLIGFLEAGLGITTLPWYAFPTDQKKLSFIPLLEPKVVRQIGIFTLKGKSLSPAAQALVNHISNSYQSI